ncbi:hypothetical protein HBH56_198820 [Parastagonospora nodorum]|uniref:Uncharacterized protein n=2 Tax=Phaeosphaeria nodorum (strain SN15 / ATCC MYA-4574 / FGSC 10173) TaxID=321614 RepID=A0A7U2F2Z1_PHANO|nr:hypothetical protein HBH56_198820 [Parastagonospora nodorum]QRC97718.1 hypothetical protein JI435_085140 [Parastagonospora nodorum SN15]KAH3924769.1 hypothetical protein HBH54_191780 [Parastagonospora nodorum]KAH3965961.1 hypothetical protein HBH52_202280 [Parastagonospora nodorum]KAH4130668.1 hypothetical protein HBH45_194420 [Parastagonospora nodorum]
MSSRGPHSAYSSSSRSSSPTTPPAQHDPFASEADPIELSDISQRPNRSRRSNESRSRSPLPSPNFDETDRGRASLHPDTSFGLSYDRTAGQYAPVTGRNESPHQSTRSGRESTYTQSSLYRSKLTDADTQALLDRRAGEIAQWHVHWTTPALIGILFISGVIAAVGHHLYYRHLNGQPAHDQLKKIRYGTALAFFVKSTLVGTSIMCNRQRIWRTFRTKAMTIDGIDGLFSAPDDPTQFFVNGEMWRNGKLATFMALCCWLIPLASVMSPASLTSEITAFEVPSTCQAVANINFARESDFDFRVMPDNETRREAMSYYNTTDVAGTKDGFFDYYDQPSKNVRRLGISAAYLRRPQPRDQAALSFCGEGWNCSYSINFMGPGYKCEDLTDAPPDNAPFKLNQIAPEGNFTYVADVDQDDYRSPQVDTLDGVPIEGPPYPASLGVFESEPALWIGYALQTNESYPPDSPNAKKWKVVHVPKMFRCVMHHTNYTFNMTYSPSQVANLTQRDFLAPVIDTHLTPNTDNTSDWVASPSTNYIRPLDDPKLYKLTAAYHSMGALLRSFLRGSVSKSTDVYVVTKSDISETRLMDTRTSHPSPNLMADVQGLFEDMLLSLLSEPTLVVAQPQDVACLKTRTLNVFRYYKRGLWYGYAIVIGITFVFILIGAWSIHQNGVASDVLFSRIMVTTRNPTLDHLSVGACLGGDPFPRELTRTKLRFGVLAEEGPREGPLGVVEHCCFGTVGETREIVKGGVYAGLRRREEKKGLLDREGEEDLVE